MSLRLLLCLALQVYGYVLLGRVIVSFIPLFKPDWAPPAWFRPVLDVIYGLTEPPLQLIRRVVPQPMGMPFDLSFIVLYLLVGVVLPRIIC